METFRKLMTYINVYGKKLDVIKRLPVEVAGIIFGFLDNRTLGVISEVSTTWRGRSEYEARRRRRMSGFNPKRLPRRYSEEIGLTLVVNGRNGEVTKAGPRWPLQFTRSSNEDKKRNLAKTFRLSNMRLWNIVQIKVEKPLYTALYLYALELIIFFWIHLNVSYSWLLSLHENK